MVIIDSIGKAERVAGGAMNPGLDLTAISKRYTESKPSIMHFDDFLTPTSLRRLRAFCEDSTIWYDVKVLF